MSLENLYIVLKYQLNVKTQFIKYTTFIKELQDTISLLTGNIKIDVVQEIIKFIENIDLYDNNNDNEIEMEDIEEIDIDNNKNSFEKSDIENNNDSRESLDNNISSLIEERNKIDLSLDDSFDNNKSLENSNNNMNLELNSNNEIQIKNNNKIFYKDIDLNKLKKREENYCYLILKLLKI